MRVCKSWQEILQTSPCWKSLLVPPYTREFWADFALIPGSAFEQVMRYSRGVMQHAEIARAGAIIRPVIVERLLAANRDNLLTCRISGAHDEDPESHEWPCPDGGRDRNEDEEEAYRQQVLKAEQSNHLESSDLAIEMMGPDAKIPSSVPPVIVCAKLQTLSISVVGELASSYAGFSLPSLKTLILDL